MAGCADACLALGCTREQVLDESLAWIRIVLEREGSRNAKRALDHLDAVTLSCHSLFSKEVGTALRDWRGALSKRAGICTASPEEEDLVANRASAFDAAVNTGAAAGAAS